MNSVFHPEHINNFQQILSVGDRIEVMYDDGRKDKGEVCLVDSWIINYMITWSSYIRTHPYGCLALLKGHHGRTFRILEISNMDLKGLKESVSDKTPEEVLALVLEIRKSRRATTKGRKVTARAQKKEERNDMLLLKKTIFDMSIEQLQDLLDKKKEDND